VGLKTGQKNDEKTVMQVAAEAARASPPAPYKKTCPDQKTSSQQASDQQTSRPPDPTQIRNTPLAPPQAAARWRIYILYIRLIGVSSIL